MYPGMGLSAGMLGLGGGMLLGGKSRELRVWCESANCDGQVLCFDQRKGNQ